MEQTKRRRFSLEDNFMKARIDTQLYGFMRCLSTALPTDETTENGNKKWKEYLLKDSITKNRKLIMEVCGIGTVKTLNRHLEQLIEVGLVEEGTFEVNGFDYDCYYFPYDYHGIYKLINKDLLFVIVNGLQPLSLKIYLYLLNSSGVNENYEFTLNELKDAFGYSQSTKTVDKVLNLSLSILQELKIIDYEDIMKEYIDKYGVLQKKPVKKLLFIATECPENLKKKLKIPE